MLDLWDSYEDDALVIDKDAGVFLDPAKVHLTNHKGKVFSVQGRSTWRPRRRGRPVVVQAGAS